MCFLIFSECRDRQKIEAIVREIESTPELNCWMFDPEKLPTGQSSLFIGSPEGVKQAAFKAIKKALS
jgi:glutamate formiminotransferase/formiminotetrahydrofolate cyclodeaminase